MSKSRPYPSTYTNDALSELLGAYSLAELSRKLGKSPRQIGRYLRGPEDKDGARIPLGVAAQLKAILDEQRATGELSKTPYYNIATKTGKRTQRILANGELSKFVDIDVEGLTSEEIIALIEPYYRTGDYKALRFTCIVDWQAYFDEKPIRMDQIQIAQYRSMYRRREVGYKMGQVISLDRRMMPNYQEGIRQAFNENRTEVLAGTIITNEPQYVWADSDNNVYDESLVYEDQDDWGETYYYVEDQENEDRRIIVTYRVLNKQDEYIDPETGEIYPLQSVADFMIKSVHLEIRNPQNDQPRKRKRIKRGTRRP